MHFRRLAVFAGNSEYLVDFMLFNNGNKPIVVLFQSQANFFVSHPDIITIEKLAAWLRYAKLILLDLPYAIRVRAQFRADYHTIWSQVHRPVGCVGNVVAYHPRSNLFCDEESEFILGS